MSESKPSEVGEQHSLWLLREFVGDEGDTVLDEVCQQGRVERWGHAARMPIFADGDDVIVVVDGNVIVGRGDGDERLRLSRGDIFGKTPKGRIASSARQPALDYDLTAVRETTICTIPRGKLRAIWEDQRAKKSVDAGRWFRKQRVEVPVWPLLGTMPTTRLARVLLHLVENYGEIDGERGRLPIHIRPGQLADLAGIEEARADRVWELFEGTGLVEIDGGALLLDDLPKLRKYALG